MTKVARRDFLRLGAARERKRVELSCERLYMRYLDAIDELNTAELLESVERDLGRLDTLRLTGAGWLTREDFHAWLEPLLDRLKARNVQIVFEPSLRS